MPNIQKDEVKTIVVRGRSYELDDCGCLKRFEDWTPDFAAAVAEEAGIEALTEAHMKVIRYLREAVERTRRTPIVHRTCRDNGLKLRDLERLFPAGYHRGACVLAGLNYFGIYPTVDASACQPPSKTYRIDGSGFMVDPAEWDETFAALRAEELGITLSERHWAVLNFLRNAHMTTGKVPTVFETCRSLKLEAEDLERLFPQGYHRGAVKLAGLSASR